MVRWFKHNQIVKYQEKAEIQLWEMDIAGVIISEADVQLNIKII